MKKMQSESSKSIFRKKVLASLVAAASASLIATGVSQASDIEIYQEAKSGQITLMMLFDISGSMGAPQLTGDADACDIPSGTSVSSSGSEQSTNGSPQYTRYYCMVNKDAYFYKRTGSDNNYQYYKCGANGSTSTGACTISIPELPANASEMNPSGTNPMYYLRPKSSSKYYDRITRLKDSMFDLLYGNTNKRITKLDDDKVIGLSAYSFNGIGNNGFILVPARRLGQDVVINGVTKKQRDILLDAVATKLYARGGTPTGNAYAEAAAYMMGTKTFNDSELYDFSSQNSGKGAPVFLTYNSGATTYYTQCNTWDTSGNCTYWPSANHSNTAARTFNFFPVDMSAFTTNSCTVTLKRSASSNDGNVTGTCYYYKGKIARDIGTSYFHGFNYTAGTKNSTGNSYEKPASLNQTDEIKKCSGQGIYVLTDGAPSNQHDQKKAMQNALSGTSISCTEQAGDNDNPATSCVLAFNEKLLTQSNPLSLKIKTAVVGFGGDFNSITSYDPNKTRAENIAALGTINSPTKAAAEWGIYGEGGWYSASDSQDVVDSVNNFINNLSTEIPAVTTGSPTIPKDALNPAVLQNDAYYQQFEPTPDKTYQLWMGNLKKYYVATGGILKDKNGKKIVDDDGKILDNYDYWAYPVQEAKKDSDGDTPGSTKFALHGGVWSQLALRTNPINDPVNGTVQRKVLTNRVYINGSGTGATFGENSSNTLRPVKPTDLTDANYKNDPNRGYLVRLLGYNIDAANPPANTDALKTAPEFRQMGAVMHSSPLLVTNKGKLNFNTSTKTMQSTNREDYVLFGSTQGILHVVKAGSSGVAGGGEEVFAFVPNEMVERQKQAFEKVEATNGGIDNLYYGIDGPWTAYTEYVIDSSGYLTVGNGKGNQKGVQDVYGGLRMGGKSYYALDLRDINNPKMKLHIDPSGTCSDTNPLGCMGESWSKPAIGFVNWGGKRTRVMFVGGGYDRVGGSDNKGYENPKYDQSNKIGAGVYMFRAEDEKGVGTGKAGQLLWWSSANAKDKTTVPIAKNNEDMKYSVVSEIRTVDRDGDDLIDHIYFGDLGGQIFRADFDNKQSAIANFSKKPVRIFDGHKASGKSPRFYDMPAFSLYSSNGTIFAVISQGSGNRSKPLFADGTYDYDAIYNIYDKDVARKDLYSATSWSTQNIKPDNSTGLLLLTDNERKNDSTIKAPASSKGWYYEFTKCVTGKGACNSYTKQTEKVFGTPIVLNKKLFVSTFDASKDGLAGDCGAGVKGASLMTTFCMPFGQCKSTDATGTTHSIIGAGIHTITVGNDDPNGGGGSGDGSGGNGGGGGGNNPPPDVNGRTKNYCISTGGRMTITVAGGIGTGEQTKMCLIPQRWYEKFR